MATGAGIYLAAGSTVLLSLLLGAALCVHDRGWSWLAPGCGFAAVLAITWIAVRLPGDGITGAILLAAAAVASVVRLRGRIEWRELWVGLPTGGLVLFAASLPFLANQRFGPLGATVNDDLALHLEFAEVLTQGDDATSFVDVAYPVGPHSIVAALSDALGLSIESAFMGVLIALPVLTALTALAALQHVTRPAQPIGAVLVGLGYLSAAFFVQASFKETVIASLVLTFTLVLRELVQDRTHWRRWVAPLIFVMLAGLGTFSVPAFLWFVGIGVTVTLVTMVTGRLRPDLRFAVGVAALAAALVATIAIFEAMTSFFSLGPGRFVLSASEGGRGSGAVPAGGNLFEPLSFFEGLGVWPTSDFRFQPDEDGWQVAAGLAAFSALIGLGLAAVRREWVLLSATVFSVAIWGLVSEISLAYNAAKALVIAAPLLALVIMSGLLMRVRRPVPAVTLALLAGLFTVAAAHSSVEPLKNGIVRPNTQSEAFAEMRAAVAGRPTLFIGRENYAAWELRSTRIAYLGLGARAKTFGLTPQRGVTIGRDLESVNPKQLNEMEMIVAPNTLFQSLPGPEFREVKSNRWYRLYRRLRPSPPRYALREYLEPGGYLYCTTPRGKRALRAGGRAFVRPAPVIGPVNEWTFPGGGQTAIGSAVALTGNREEIRQTISLPRGRWEISLSWASSLPIDATIDGRRYKLPPYIGDGDRHWRVTSVRGGRAIEVVILPGPERRFDVPRGAQIGRVAAVREDVKGRFVPVRRACGRYVDWIER